MDSYKTLADETCQISKEELNKIWTTLEENAGENSSGHYRSQINGIAAELISCRLNLKNLWNSELESDFYKIFNVPLKKAQSNS